jgi:hypothetical protein
VRTARCNTLLDRESKNCRNGNSHVRGRALTIAACGGTTSSPTSTVTVTQSQSSTPSWSSSTPSSVFSSPETTSPVASAPITIPDLTGENAKIAENRLKALGFTDIDLVSATEKYQNVFVPANWTVVAIEPAPGTTVNASDTVILKVTKP